MRPTPDKRISVVMATYNGEKYIREQIDSILLQTYPIYELIIQDDGSTDNTCSIVREYLAKDDRIKLYINPSNLGFNKNFRTACQKATGDYIAISDQDDIWYPQKLEKQICTIGESIICYSGFHQGSTPEIEKCTREFSTPIRREWTPFFRTAYGHSLLLRSDFAQDQDNWCINLSEQKEPIMCYDFWLTYNAFFKGDVAFVSEPLNWHRTHSLSHGHISRYKLSIHSRPPKNYLMKLIEGYARRIRLSKTDEWQAFYHTLARIAPKHSIEQQIALLSLKPHPLSIIKLCWLCMKHRYRVYPNSRSTSSLSLVWKSFFHPIIFTYYVTSTRL